jgi:hypothetical protein
VKNYEKVIYSFVILYVISVIMNVQNFVGLFNSATKEKFIKSGDVEICDIITFNPRVDEVIDLIYNLIYWMLTQILILWFFWPS